MIKRHFNSENQILYIHYSGTIVLEEVVENAHRVFQDFDLSRKLLVLEDAREATYDLPIEGNEKILEAIGNYVEDYEFIKVAMLQDKPREAAINMDYEYQMPFPNFKYKVFSVEKTALFWLKNNF